MLNKDRITLGDVLGQEKVEHLKDVVYQWTAAKKVRENPARRVAHAPRPNNQEKH